jgi:ribosome-binding factor A
VYWIVGEQKRIPEVQAAFDAAAGFFRKSVSQALGTRSVPQLRFYYDDTLDTSAEIERLFERVEAQRAGATPSDASPKDVTEDKS